MRPSLYVRDDDWRLSLMAGNFVTLTNLPPQEMDRMIERHASPLYISVQTTNGELRKKMLHHIHADRIMEHLRRFAAHDMSFHCQVVLCPGINDGPELERTMHDLASLVPCTARGLFSLLTSFIRSQSIRCQTWTATRIFRSLKTASVCSPV